MEYMVWYGMVRDYNLKIIKDDPTIFLTKMIGLESEQDFIKAHEKRALPVLTGLILYRQLNKVQQRKVLKEAQGLGNKFFGKVQGIVATNIFNPTWNPWCLSNSELRAMFNINSSVSKFLGTYFFTLEGKLEIGFLAAAILSLSKDGMVSTLFSQAGVPIAETALKKLSFRASVVKLGSRVFLVAVLLASAMKNFTDADAKAAKIELLNRGLLTASDL